MGIFRRVRRADDPSERHARLEERVKVYEVLAAAMERRLEVFRVLEAAPDPETASRGLQELLGTDAAGAQWVMDMPLRRMPRSERDRVTAELEHLRRERDGGR